MIRNFLLVGVGGAAGSMARYGISYAINRVLTHPFPLATFLINVMGCLLIGVLFGLVSRYNWMQQWGVLLLASGFCGGFTTFSTFALENVTLMQKSQSAVALVYTFLSIAIGLLLCRVGMWLTA